MGEWASESILYWHWIVAGLLLITVEVFVPIFVMLWLGVAAVLVGALLYFFPFSFAWQLLVWVLFSAAFVLLWHKLVSPRMSTNTLAGLSSEAITGQVGMVVFFNALEGRGRLKFPAPILGNDEWEFIYDQPLQNGDKLQVVDLSGNSVIVRKF